MSAFAINRAEKKILTHIQCGGAIDDATGKSLLCQFTSTALKDSQIFDIAKRYDISFDDICVIYIAMVSQLMPNPCIEAGGLLLVPTLIFMEPIRFEGLASEIQARTRGCNEKERIYAIVSISSDLAHQIWEAHAAARGAPRFRIVNVGGRPSSGGCFSVIVLIFSFASAAGYSLYKIFT